MQCEWLNILNKSCDKVGIERPSLPLKKWVKKLDEDVCKSLCPEILRRHKMSQTAFCLEFKINRGNFSRWLAGHVNSKASLEAVQKLLIRGIQAKGPDREAQQVLELTQLCSRCRDKLSRVEEERVVLLIAYASGCLNEEMIEKLSPNELYLYTDTEFDNFLLQLGDSEWIHRVRVPLNTIGMNMAFDAALRSNCWAVTPDKSLRDLCKKHGVKTTTSVISLICSGAVSLMPEVKED